MLSVVYLASRDATDFMLIPHFDIFSLFHWKQSPFTRSFSQPLDFTDEQILRLIGATGDQQIISREFINGEHHILTRNENGEHIITRIVTVCELDRKY